MDEKENNLGEKMAIEDFICACQIGAFIDYDGFGYYLNADGKETDIIIRPSDVAKGNLKEGFTWINWYNR
jgi:hypothetical protein